MSEPTATSSSATRWATALFAASTPSRRHVPRDLLGLIVGATFSALAWLRLDGEFATLRVDLPHAFAFVLTLTCAIATMGLVAFFTLAAVAARRWLLAGTLVAALVVAALLSIAANPIAEPRHTWTIIIISGAVAACVVVVRALVAPLRTPSWILVFAGVFALTLREGVSPLHSLAACAIGLTTGSLVAFSIGIQSITTSVEEVEGFVATMDTPLHDVRLSSVAPLWGAVRFDARDEYGAPMIIDVYGRDAPQGQMFNGLWRLAWQRNSRLDLRVHRTDHVEHLVGMLLWASARHVRVPDVVCAAVTQPRRDAVLVTRRPDGTLLSTLSAPDVSDACLASMWHDLAALHEAGIAIRGLSTDSIAVHDHRCSYLDFSQATAMASARSMTEDDAALFVAICDVVGVERAVAVSRLELGDARLAALLSMIQRAALAGTSDTRRVHHGERDLKELRERSAQLLDVPVVQVVPLSRFKWSQVVMLVATFLGVWLLVQQFIGMAAVGDIVRSANWWTVLGALVITQITALSEALAISGTLPAVVPLGQLTVLRLSLAFIGLIGGTVATTAAVIRFNQRHGLGAAIAVSSGVIYSVCGFIVEIILVGVSLPFVIDSFHRNDSPGLSFDTRALNTVLWVIIAVAVVAAALFAIPKIRALVVRRSAPTLTPAWNNLKQIARQPARIGKIFAGQVATQLMMAIGLGLALLSVGSTVSFGCLIVICTATSLLGGLAPVPGGMGVMEASFISGLTLAGVPEGPAIAATFIYRMVTAYLPPIWGWVAMLWLRHTDAL